MSYTVKWIPGDRSRVVRSPQSFARPDDALAFAFAALDWRPADVWVEDARGNRVMTQAMIERIERGHRRAAVPVAR